MLEKGKATELMKTIINRSLLAGVFALAATVAAQAQDVPPPQQQPGGYSTTTTEVLLWPGYAGPRPGQAGDIYLDGEIGGNLQQDLTIHNAPQKVGFYPGEAFTLSLGGDITESLALELETGATYDNINTDGSTALAFSGNHADMYQVPIVGNLIFKAPLPGGLTPYVGAGFGGIASELEVHQRGFWADDTDFTPAYSGLAGIKCALNRMVELGIGYRFLGTTSHTWFANNPNLYTPAGPTFSHSILATLTLSF
jgi:opacity protein-like surface antigen